MERRCLLDAFGLLLFLQKEGAYDRIKQSFRRAEESACPILINEMCVGEVFSEIARKHSMERADSLLPLVQVLPLQIVSNGLEDILRAARIKAEHALDFIEALTVATAQREQAALITANPALKAVEHLIEIEWLDVAQGERI